jgi:hypothetical protein
MANSSDVPVRFSCNECTITAHRRQCKGDVLLFPYQLDLSWVIAFQSLGDWLVLPMRFVSFLGTEEFYILIMPILYWCVDASLGI